MDHHESCAVAATQHVARLLRIYCFGAASIPRHLRRNLRFWHWHCGLANGNQVDSTVSIEEGVDNSSHPEKVTLLWVSFNKGSSMAVSIPRCGCSGMQTGTGLLSPVRPSMAAIHDYCSISEYGRKCAVRGCRSAQTYRIGQANADTFYRP